MGRNDAFGLADSLEYFEMELDSYDATTAAVSSASKTDWPLFYFSKQFANIAGIKVLEAEIPFSFYVFNSNNNTFQISVGLVIPNAIVTIPVGNYTAENLATTVAQRMQAAVLAIAPGFTGTFSGSYSGSGSAPHTGKFRFVLQFSPEAPATGFTMTFGPPGDNGNFSPRLFLGFESGTTSSTFVPGTGAVINAQYFSQVTGPNYVYLNSRKLGALVDLYLPSGASNIGAGNTGSQIAKIPVSVQPGGTIFWQDPDPMKYFDFENLINLSDLDLYLTLGNSSNQVPLELNGLSFSVKIGVLVNKMVSNNLLGGNVSANRVFARMQG